MAAKIDSAYFIPSSVCSSVPNLLWRMLGIAAPPSLRDAILS
jgi:hypothetical protein